VDRVTRLPSRPRGPRVTARTQVIGSLLIGILVAVFVSLFGSLRFGPLVGWDATALIYMMWVWKDLWPAGAEQTSSLAVYEDPTRALADLLLLTSSVVSLVAVGFVLLDAAQSTGLAEVLRVGLGLASVVLSWAIVHTVFALRYARLFYGDIPGGVDFNQEELPTYRDFAYLAFTVGMTFQVSDTNLQSGEIRRTVLRQALLSYLFSTFILATTINLVVALSST
jgi:uncharacterized membrane protein